jgi:PKD repeat protein
MNDTKIMPKVILLCGLVVVSLLVPSVAAAVTHPITWNIRQTPGYLNQNIEPYKSTYALMLSYANDGLNHNFNAGPHMEALRNMPVIYQVTGDTRYANKTVDALLAFNGASSSYFFDVGYAAISYDLIAGTAGTGRTTLSAANNTIIRHNLAKGADSLYQYSLNLFPYSYDYTGADDYYGKWYPQLAIAGIVLADYSNSSLSSTPATWESMGTTALFVRDTVSSFPAQYGLLSTVYNRTNGKSFMDEGYMGYIDTGLYRWYNIYQNAKGHSIFDDYPEFKATLYDDVWSDLPNRYGSNWGTDSQYASTTVKYTLALLDKENRSNVRWHLNQLNANVAADLIPSGGVTRETRKFTWAAYDPYLMQYDFSNESAHPPAKLNTINGIFNVIRSDWSDRADWISFIVWSTIPLGCNRWGVQHDQLTFEYYSHGDLLVPDSGEVKEMVSPYQNFNEEGAYHNGLLIGSATTSWPRSKGTTGYAGIRPNLTTRGIVKAYNWGDVTSAVAGPAFDTGYMTYKEGGVTIKKVEPITAAAKYPDPDYTLPSPIAYSRAILYPKDYFIVIDRASSPINYKYTNAFHFTSLNINKTTSPSGNTPLYNVGNVKGTLAVQGTPIDWKRATPFVEYDYSTQANSVTWDTTNLYGEQVNLNLFTSPKTGYTYEKMITRVAGGYGGNDRVAEVFTPFVYFNQPANRTLYRVTALLTKYGTENAQIPSELPVTGTGSAIKVISANGSYTDYIYTGSGTSAFGGFITDADSVFVRKTGLTRDFTLINGSYLKDGSNTLVTLSKKADYLSLDKEAKTIKFKIRGQGDAEVKFQNIYPSAVIRDGLPYTNWIMTDNGTNLTITTSLSEHDFEISTRTLNSPVAGFTGTPTSGSVPLIVSFMDTSTGFPTEWNWTFGDGSLANITEQNPVHTYLSNGTYTVNLTVKNADGSNTSTRKSYITVGAPGAPTITSITPNSGPTKENTPITIRGTNFVSGGLFGVKIGGVAATNVVRINATAITAKTPEGSAGAKIVAVINNDGQTATKASGFTYVAPPIISIDPPATHAPPGGYAAPPTTCAALPTISSITPNSGPIKGNTPITISGTNFVSGGSFGVKIGGVAATSVSRINATTITAKTPAGTAGARTVAVTNNDGQTATKASGFTYV